MHRCAMEAELQTLDFNAAIISELDSYGDSRKSIKSDNMVDGKNAVHSNKYTTYFRW